MAIRQSKGGIWHVRMLADVGWCGVKKGEVVEVPNRVVDHIASRWVDDGTAEPCDGPKVVVSNKAVGKAKGTRAVASA